MKGPYERLKYDLRRIWECPKCQARQRTDGTTTALICGCQLALVENERVSMNLLHDGIRRSSVKQPEGSRTSAPESEETHTDSKATIPENSDPPPSEEGDQPTTTADAGKTSSAPDDSEATSETIKNGDQNSASSDSSDDSTCAE